MNDSLKGLIIGIIIMSILALLFWKLTTAMMIVLMVLLSLSACYVIGSAILDAWRWR